MRILSLCDGMSCGYMAAITVFDDVEYWAVEIDKHPRKLSDSNFGDKIHRPCHDVNEIGAYQMLYEWPEFDYVIFGSPCQSVSVAGNSEGLDGESGLLLKCMEVLALAKYRNPSAKHLIENVDMAARHQHQFNHIIGSEPTKINSNLLSAQHRSRLYWTGHECSQPKGSSLVLKDILDHDGLHIWLDRRRSNYVLSLASMSAKERKAVVKDGCNIEWSGKILPEVGDFIYNNHLGQNGKLFKKQAATLVCAGKHHTVGEIDGVKTIRQLNTRELARLQTIPDWFDFSQVSENQARKAIGNGWTISVIEHIFRESCK